MDLSPSTILRGLALLGISVVGTYVVMTAAADASDLGDRPPPTIAELGPDGYEVLPDQAATAEDPLLSAEEMFEAGRATVVLQVDGIELSRSDGAYGICISVKESTGTAFTCGDEAARQSGTLKLAFMSPSGVLFAGLAPDAATHVAVDSGAETAVAGGGGIISDASAEDLEGTVTYLDGGRSVATVGV